jgi:antitoxin VapB
MALYVKDPEVDRLARALADLRGMSKTDVIKAALRREMEREKEDDFVSRVLAFTKRVKAEGNFEQGQPADKAFRDSLYED